MSLAPWLIWVPALSIVNLLLFVAVRGRWGRIVIALSLASLAGVVLGDWIAESMGVEFVRIGDMNVLAASVMAQALMVVVTLLGALGPIRVED